MTSSDLPRVKNSRNFRFALQPCSYRTKVQAHRCLIYKVQSAVFKEFSQLFVVLNCSSTAYLVYQNQKHLSRTFFKFFFEESSRSKSNFSVLRLSLRDSFNRIPNPRSNVKSFFVPIRHLFLVSPHKTNYKSRNRQPCADRWQRTRNNIQCQFGFFLFFIHFWAFLLV